MSLLAVLESALGAEAGPAAERAAAALDAAAAAARGAGGEEGLAAETLASLAGGDPAEAESALVAAARAYPQRAWPLVLAGRTLLSRGEYARAAAELTEAARREPRAWVFDELGRAHEKAGDMERALFDADAALADAPTTARYLRRAHVQVCRRHYHMALPDFLAAAKREPDRLEAWLGAASVELTRGRVARAREFARRAERAAPGQAGPFFESVRYEILSGRPGPALARLARAPRALARSAEAEFLRGLGAVKSRAFARAAARFAAAERAGAGDFARKAAFFRVLASGLVGLPARLPKPRGGRARLLICGLGGAPPYTASLGALRMAASCDFVFNNLSEPEIAGLLRLLAPEGEPTMFDIRGADRRWTRTIFRRVKPGRTVGFITRGHPQVCGGLAASLMQECARVGADFSILPAVSSMDALTLRAMRGGEAWGQQVVDWSVFYDDAFRLDPRLPLVLYFNAAAQAVTAEEYARFCAKLEAAYGPEREAWLYGRSFAAEPDVVRLRDARAWHRRIDPSYTLLVPPRDPA